MTPTKMDDTTTRRVGFTHLRRIRRSLDKLDALYESRLDTIRELRALDPPVPWAKLAEACGTSEPNLIQLVRKADARTAAANGRKRK